MGPTGSDPSRIEWTEATWNPVTGCTQMSPGCKRGYAERLAKRLKAMGSPRYRNGFRVTLHEDVVYLPLPSTRGYQAQLCEPKDRKHSREGRPMATPVRRRQRKPRSRRRP